MSLNEVIKYGANEIKSLRTFNKIDSLRIRIPIDKIKITNNIYLSAKLEKQDLTVVADDGELSILDWRQLKQEQAKGIKIYYDLIRMKITFIEMKEFLVIGISSKIMKDRYFLGLHDLKYIHAEICERIGIQVKFDDFIKSDCYDIDIAIDVIMSSDAYDLMLDTVADNAKSSKNRGEGVSRYRGKNNNGVEFGDRNNKDWRKKVHFKIYDKALELLSKSRDFYGEYLRDIDFKQVKRFEANIRNRQVLRDLEINDCSLKNIMDHKTMDKLKMIFEMAKKAHFEKQVLKTSKYMSGTDQALSILILFAVEKGLIFDDFINRLEVVLTERHLRKRTIDKMKYLYTVLRDEGFDVIDYSDEMQQVLLTVFPSYDEGKKVQNYTTEEKIKKIKNEKRAGR